MRKKRRVYPALCRHERVEEVPGSRRFVGMTRTGRWDEILVECRFCRTQMDRIVRSESEVQR